MRQPLRRDSMRNRGRVRAAGGGVGACLSQNRGVGGPPLFFWSGGWGTPSYILERPSPPFRFLVLGGLPRRGSIRNRVRVRVTGGGWGPVFAGTGGRGSPPLCLEWGAPPPIGEGGIAVVPESGTQER